MTDDEIRIVDLQFRVESQAKHILNLESGDFRKDYETRITELEGKLRSAEVERELYKSVIGKDIKVWESLLEASNRSPNMIAKWLRNEMIPVLRILRRVFRKKGIEQ